MVEDGAYRRLLDRYYATEEPLPTDETVLFRVIRARTGEEQNAVRIILLEFFRLTDAGWTQKRCDVEIEAYKDKVGKAINAANKRWGKVDVANSITTECKRNARAILTECERIPDAMPTNNQDPITKNQKPRTNKLNSKSTTPFPSLTQFNGVDPKVVADFTALRDKKRAPITGTAIDGIKAEAEKAGLSLEAALRICCQRGWQGFEAGWVLPRHTPPLAATNNQQLGKAGQATARAAEQWLTEQSHG
jgi:uncharacterized protein YdaU (DUF1376 family)